MWLNEAYSDFCHNPCILDACFLPVVNVVPFVCFPLFVVRVVAMAMYRGLDTARRTAQPCLSPWKQATRTLESSSTSTSISPNLSVLWVEFFRDCLLSLSFFSLFFGGAKQGVVGHLFVQVNRLEILFLAVPKRFSSSGRWAKLGLQYELPQRKSSLGGRLVQPILFVSDGANQWWNKWWVEVEEKWFVALKKVSEMMHLVLLFVLLTFSSQKGKAYFFNFIFLLLVLCLCNVFGFCFCPLPCHLN